MDRDPNSVASVLRLLHVMQVTTRSELEEITNLSPSTVSKAVRQLIETGYARENGLAPSTGGRPSRWLAFRPEARLAIGAEFSRYRIRTVITDLNATTRQTYEAEPVSTSPDGLTEPMIELIRRALVDAGLDRVVGLGIAVPGIADSRQGLLEYYPDINLRNYPLGEIVRSKLGIFPVIYNRVNAAAIGESRQGAGRAAHSLYYISVGDGIGGGMVLRGQLYQGASTAGSEIGHVTVAPNGDLCYCGNRGCLFTVASGPALAGRFREQIKQGQTSRLVAEVDGRLDLLDGMMVLKAAYTGDEVAMQIVSSAAEYLGIALANVVNLLSPEVIVLGGPLIDDCPEPWVNLIRKSLHRHALSGPMLTTQIVVGQLGMLSRSVGAAALAITAWLKSEAPAHFVDLAELPVRQLQP